MNTALLVIDVQNEYFAEEEGAFAQADALQTAERIADAVRRARNAGQLVVAVQHISPDGAAMFRRNTHGAAIHRTVADLLADCPLIEKQHADSFLNTKLNDILQQHGIRQIDLCGIMTQNCITHTALSPNAAPYRVRVLAQECTAPTALIHRIALNALRDRVEVV